MALMSRPEIDDKTGLTEPEGKVLALICEAWGAFCELPVTHPDDMRTRCDAVHVIQGLLMQRVAQRAYPVGWPTKTTPG